MPGGYYDEMGFYILPDNQGFYDPRGVYFDKEGFDEHGGYYDEEGKFYSGGTPPKKKTLDDDELIRQFEAQDDDDSDGEEVHDELQNRYYQEFKKKERVFVETAALG